MQGLSNDAHMQVPDSETLSRRRWLASCALAGLAPAAQAHGGDLLITLRAPDSPGDLRNLYVRDAVQLALEKTRSSHGPYRIQQSETMNKRRALLVAREGKLPNFVLTSSPETVADSGLAPVPFPIHLGVNGYRICFVNRGRQQAVRAAANLDAIARLRHVQGQGWADVGVLRANGFQVAEVARYESLFSMVALGRADLFCRSILEIAQELQAHRHLQDLVLEDSFTLVYELPQYLYTHPANRIAIQRLQLGLEQAFADGSLQALLRRHLQPSLDLVDLPRRRHYTLKTPQRAGEIDSRRYQLDLRAR